MPQANAKKHLSLAESSFRTLPSQFRCRPAASSYSTIPPALDRIISPLFDSVARSGSNFSMQSIDRKRARETRIGEKFSKRPAKGV